LLFTGQRAAPVACGRHLQHLDKPEFPRHVIHREPGLVAKTLALTLAFANYQDQAFSIHYPQTL